MVLYRTVLYMTALYMTILYMTELYMTVLYMTVLYRTVLYKTEGLHKFGPYNPRYCRSRSRKLSTNYCHKLPLYSLLLETKKI